MKFHDALLAGPEHGADRLSVEADRRLRRRLGLDARASTSRVWLRPAIGTFAIAAAVVVAVILYPAKSPTHSPQHVATGFVDISNARWSGTVTGNEIDVRGDSPSSAKVAWANATVVAAPGTQLTAVSASTLSLAHGAIEVQRKDATPMAVEVPMGRVVIAAYHSSVTADRESVTILLSDGSGHYEDASGQTHPLVPNTPLVWPPPPATDGSGDASTPAPVQPPRKRPTGRTNVAPGAVSSPEQEVSPAPPAPPVPRPDVPCTFKSDCDPGQTCRENERGASVCMGHGEEGAACWFDNDCVSQRCSQRRCAGSP